MVVLEKIRASTLMETLVATILIVIVFVISSMILNNLFSNSIKNNTRAIDAELSELQYLYKNDKLTIPYTDDFKDWQILVDSYKENNNTIIEFEAINSKTSKTVNKEIIETK
ncbi:hypothetical protein HSX10_07305 [Winogradskyella undariae]|uniref:hypothetical protein n=1 Tax=Winogradskyella undariae TaxID=1285465 RepID=UPI00156ABB67|nr:hypothetical protein [Winogradskyella undariae]NRR91367.1 hypothetical protein [Winogradskyella undariae]